MSTANGIGTSAVAGPASAHGEHGTGSTVPAAPANQNTANTFANVLSQTVARPSVVPGHGGHAGGAALESSLRSGNGGAALSSTAGDPNSRHFPLAGQSHHGKNHMFQETALRLRAYRQELIAANIANADTPGYQAVDIEFQRALEIAQSAAQVTPVSLSKTSVSHLSGRIDSRPSFPLKYHVPSQPSVDGNTVEMDVERAKFAENSLMYEFGLDRVGNHYKMKIELLQSLKD